MSRQLLDVNVFFALLWPQHKSHVVAQQWFSKHGHTAWATSPLTQMGVLRLLTNSAVTHGAVNFSMALQVVNQAVGHEGHSLFRLPNDVIGGLRQFGERLRGHQRWTDAVLLSQAIAQEGVLVTFDGGVRELAGREFGAHVNVLKG